MIASGAERGGLHGMSNNSNIRRRPRINLDLFTRNRRGHFQVEESTEVIDWHKYLDDSGEAFLSFIRKILVSRLIVHQERTLRMSNLAHNILRQLGRSLPYLFHQGIYMTFSQWFILDDVVVTWGARISSPHRIYPMGTGSIWQ